MELKNYTRTIRRRAGMAMVEMVIILPLLLMMLFAIAEFGVVFGRWQTLTNAAREGAREAVVFRSPCDSTTVQDEVTATIQDYADAGGITLASGDINVTGACGAANTDTAVTITHSYTFEVLPGFAQSLNPSVDLSTSATMRNEGSG